MQENWRPITGIAGYEVSDQGRIRSAAHVILKPRSYGPKDKQIVSLSLDNYTCNKSVHHAVLEAFVSPKPKGYLATHLDQDYSNNKLANLKWVPTGHTLAMQRRADPIRERKKPGKLTPEQVTWAREQYQPYSHGGQNLRMLADGLNVTEGALSRALAGKRHAAASEVTAPAGEP